MVSTLVASAPRDMYPANNPMQAQYVYLLNDTNGDLQNYNGSGGFAPLFAQTTPVYRVDSPNTTTDAWRGIKFDVADVDYFTNGTYFEPTGAWSIALWYHSNLSAEQHFVDLGGAGTNWMRSTGTIGSFSSKVNDQFSGTLDSNCDVANEWCFLVWDCDNLNVAHLYTNDNTSNAMNWGATCTGTAGVLSLGFDSRGTASHFDGMMSTVWYFNRTLDDSERTQLYEANWSNIPAIVTVNLPDDNYHDNQNLTANFTYSATGGQPGNCSLIVDGEKQKTNLNVVSGTDSNITSVNATNADYAWYISCSNSQGMVNSSVRTFVFDNVNPIITWNTPNQINSLSHNNISLFINISDTNLFRANLSVFNSSGSLFYNNYSVNVTGNSSWTYFDNLNFTEDGNYTIEVIASDSHTFGDFNGANYTFDSSGIKFTKPVGNPIMIQYGTYDGTFNQLVEKKKDDYKINTTVDLKQGEYSWNFNFEKTAVKENYAFLFQKNDKVILINSSIAHFVFLGEGIEGWYLDFEDAVEEGFTPHIVENLTSYIVYFDSSECKSVEGQRCKI